MPSLLIESTDSIIIVVQAHHHLSQLLIEKVMEHVPSNN